MVLYKYFLWIFFGILLMALGAYNLYEQANFYFSLFPVVIGGLIIIISIWYLPEEENEGIIA